jgi:hypothetical protein
VVSDSPFSYVAIRGTTVVQESTNASSFGCINVLVFLQHHKVEMSYPLLGILTHALNEGRLANNVAYILIYHVILVDIISSTNAKTLFLGLYYFDWGVLSPLKPLILTE